jgi:hypothetical protein
MHTDEHGLKRSDSSVCIRVNPLLNSFFRSLLEPVIIASEASSMRYISLLAAALLFTITPMLENGKWRVSGYFIR